tara:strand:- start:154 stop:831 length:678 start_codon:yes stop_codon:yes gene_type:complete
MSTQTRTELKTYFNTGDKPTEGQFANLIDSQLNLTDGGTVAAACDVNLAGLGTLKGNLREVIRQTAATDWNDGAYTLTVGQSGALILLDKNEATAVTLPSITAAQIGTTYTFVQTLASNTDRTINTAYDNDYFIGSVALLPSAVWAAGTAQDGLDIFATANPANDVQLTFDDDLANGAGGVGSTVTITAILTGNTGAGGGAKAVWLVEGVMATGDPNSNGTAIFT